MLFFYLNIIFSWQYLNSPEIWLGFRKNKILLKYGKIIFKKESWKVKVVTRRLPIA